MVGFVMQTRKGKIRNYSTGFSRKERLLLGICIDDGFRKAKKGRVLCEECLDLRKIRQQILYWKKKGFSL